MLPRMPLELDTPHGPARAHVHAAPTPRGALVLGHGAGGGVTARDLVAARDAALAAGVSVALVEQPYRVAGRRSPPRAPVLDAAWETVVAALAAGPFAGLPLVSGGRSSGARVACRTAAATRVRGVLCLAFPLLAPRRKDGTRPSRLDELDGVAVPVLVIQGERDPFGVPPERPGRGVVIQPGDHRLQGDVPGLRAAVGAWLEALLA
jgi:predicted alpha/beta-hydrolase family hydrolase